MPDTVLGVDYTKKKDFHQWEDNHAIIILQVHRKDSVREPDVRYSTMTAKIGAENDRRQIKVSVERIRLALEPFEEMNVAGQGWSPRWLWKED